MRASVTRAAALAAAMTLSLPAASSARREGVPFHWTGSIPAGTTLRLRGVNGSIQVLPGSGTRTVVEARKWGRRSDPDRVAIEVHEEPDQVTICARYPRRWGRGLTDCDDNARGARGDVQVDFTVRLAAGVPVVLSNVNGGIRAEGLRSRVKAATVNGSVRVETSEPAEARTVNGSIVARMRPRPGGDLRFATVNGSIRVEIPADADAHVEAATVNGSISSDFPVTIRGRWVGRRLRGTIGRGGPDIAMKTVNGSIALRAL
jgi:DUF4097 and DUF4098 domain-containing protein YvlB